MSTNHVIPELGLSPVKWFVRAPEYSWVSKCHSGDSQGNTGACAMFSVVNWIETKYDRRISDSDTINMWKNVRLQKYGNLDGGISVRDAYHEAIRCGLISNQTKLERVSNLRTLKYAPIIGCYDVTNGWNHLNSAGCIDHKMNNVTGYHATLIVAYGIIDSLKDQPKMLWIENSWGGGYGYKGLCAMTVRHHKRFCRELYQISNG
jgi:hypothetical protein